MKNMIEGFDPTPQAAALLRQYRAFGPFEAFERMLDARAVVRLPTGRAYHRSYIYGVSRPFDARRIADLRSTR